MRPVLPDFRLGEWLRPYWIGIKLAVLVILFLVAAIIYAMFYAD